MGGGLSSISSEQEFIDGTEKESDIGFTLDFKVGYAPNNKLEIYYSSQNTFFTRDDDTEGGGTSYDMISFLYFLSSKLNAAEWFPSIFMSGGFGHSTWLDEKALLIISHNAKLYTGIGFFVGTGYEFFEHFRINLKFLSSNVSKEYSGVKLEAKSTTISLTLSALAF